MTNTSAPPARPVDLHENSLNAPNLEGASTMNRTHRSWWKSAASALALAAIAMLASGPAVAQKTELLVYTALETDQIKAYEEAFKKASPNIDIKWVRDSTGFTPAKLLAEKANPKADLVVGVSASSLAVFANEGMLQ